MTTTPLRVPYITAWSEEAVEHNLLFTHHPEAGGPRLTYPDPHPTDWVYGVLRARHGLNRGGRPEWKMVNTLRQWRCMEQRLCQVCGGSAVDPETGRIWWLLSDNPDESAAVKGYTNAPPTCRGCIPEAIATCPHLRRAAATYTAGDCEPHAVLAKILLPIGSYKTIVVDRTAIVWLDEFQELVYALAQQLIVLLHDLRPVPLAQAMSGPAPTGEQALSGHPASPVVAGRGGSRANYWRQTRPPLPLSAVHGHCDHADVEWTYQRPLPDGARCRACGIWWRLDLIPAPVAERLKNDTLQRGQNAPCADDRRPS
jgi:hypothetical protein